ncbi:pyruvate, phosphate dikinase, partial [bacterium]
MSTKRVYLFREGDKSQRDLLGGKGANLAEMTNIGLPVPPGFTITTEVCTEYYAEGKKLPEGLMAEMETAVKDVEGDQGKTLGDPKNPLLLSVRSGAKFSMPGMMDTVLNLGLNDEVAEGMVAAGADARFVYDSYRRLIMMLSDVAFGDRYEGISKHTFEHQFYDLKSELGVTEDVQVPAEKLKELCERYKTYLQSKGVTFPQDVREQLKEAVEAVFRSWNNDRAIIYRRKEKIDDAIGTAVNVQAMVFGNMGDDCGTGVAFTRNASTGENVVFGEYLINAQGEDVVAGVRTPLPLEEMQEQNPPIYNEFVGICKTLEGHYKDMQDIEFTIERNKLYILQCRSGKRTGTAAVKIAVDRVNEGLISKEDAIASVNPDLLNQVLLPVIAPGTKYDVIAKGLP